jgi:cell filamentation protein, protein adenylyltransferase
LFEGARERESALNTTLLGTDPKVSKLDPKVSKVFEPRSTNDQAHAWLEVSNYASALAYGSRLLKELPFCCRLIRELHGVLMQGVRSQQSTAGNWRNYQVAIGSDRRYVPPPTPEMIEGINALEAYINQPDENFDPLVRAFLVHYQIEAIHPFSDGNGRIGRVLLSLMIAHWCNHKCPWLYLSAFFERFKDEYVENLFKISTEGAWEKWIEFCLNGTITQANDAIHRCVQLRQLKDEMHAKISDTGSTRTSRIIDRLFSNPLVRVSGLKRDFSISYPTAQSDVDRLVNVGILKPLPDVRPKAYYSPQIFSIAYKELQTSL